MEQIIEVQKQNIGANAVTARRIRERDERYPKVKELMKRAEEVAYPDVFLKAAVRTQKAASFWDGVFVGLLKVGGLHF